MPDVDDCFPKCVNCCSTKRCTHVQRSLERFPNISRREAFSKTKGRGGVPPGIPPALRNQRRGRTRWPELKARGGPEQADLDCVLGSTMQP